MILCDLGVGNGLKEIQKMEAASWLRQVAFLPKEIRGHQVLLPTGADTWRVTNQELKAVGLRGIDFRNSKSLDDWSLIGHVAFEEEVTGLDSGDGWVKASIPRSGGAQARRRPTIGSTVRIVSTQNTREKDQLKENIGKECTIVT